MPTHRVPRDKSYALDRLIRAQHYALAAQVKRGMITARAAMLEAGLSYPKIELRLDSPYAVARALRERVTPEFLAEVRRLLDE